MAPALAKLAYLVLGSTPLQGWARVGGGTAPEANELPNHPELCSPAVVLETCGLLASDAAADVDAGGNNASLLVRPSAVRHALAATAVAEEEQLFRGLWLDRLHLPAEGASCGELCTAVVSYLRSSSVVLPAASDTGCYRASDEGKVMCDLDLAPDKLADLVLAQEEFPTAKGWEHRFKDKGDASRSASVATPLVRSTDQVAIHIANLFRIYPLLGTATEHGPSLSSSALSSGWQDSVGRRGQETQAWVSLAIRRFQARQTADHVKHWFGGSSVTSTANRAHIQSVMNSISHVLSSSAFVYPGSDCGRGDIAYVYSACDGEGGDRDRNGRYLINLCPVYWELSKAEQIVTLAHEASHHSAACTEDVKYGISSCRQLAFWRPQSALRNADNFGYFVRDVAR
jgi:hypothetical protein